MRPDPIRGCDDMRRDLTLSRRSFVKAGVLGTGGLALGDLLRSDAKANGRTRANSVIILWMRGGPSHIDMWDPKPDAPVEYRGEFGVIECDLESVRPPRHVVDGLSCGLKVLEERKHHAPRLTLAVRERA